MSRFLRILFLLLTLLGPAPALADGSVSFDEDVMPLLHDRPDLRAALAEVEFYQLGSGRRISGLMSPGLAGRRVGPYLFHALHWGRPVEVRIATHARFFDREGRLLGEDAGEGEGWDLDLESAVALEEVVTAVGITPL